MRSPITLDDAAGECKLTREFEQLPRLRTTNGFERITREIKRRTRVASIFPNSESCLRLISDSLAECDGDWMTGIIYLNLKD